jgi:hypothetical protein
VEGCTSLAAIPLPCTEARSSRTRKPISSTRKCEDTNRCALPPPCALAGLDSCAIEAQDVDEGRCQSVSLPAGGAVVQVGRLRLDSGLPPETGQLPLHPKPPFKCPNQGLGAQFFFDVPLTALCQLSPCPDSQFCSRRSS